MLEDSMSVKTRFREPWDNNLTPTTSMICASSSCIFVFNPSIRSLSLYLLRVECFWNQDRIRDANTRGPDYSFLFYIVWHHNKGTRVASCVWLCKTEHGQLGTAASERWLAITDMYNAAMVCMCGVPELVYHHGHALKKYQKVGRGLNQGHNILGQKSFHNCSHFMVTELIYVNWRFIKTSS